jgi:hypothetical protein
LLAEENPPFALSLSKGLTAWFDELTTNGQEDGSTGSPRVALLMVRRAHHERVNYSGRVVVGVRRGRLARWLAEEKPPFALSLSKGLTAWFDRLTTSGQEAGSTGSPRAALLMVRQAHHERL